MTAKFDLGDIVKLKSGGPDMVVVDKHFDAVSGLSYFCGWFDKEEKYSCLWFREYVVIKRI